MANPQKPPYRRKNLADISYTDRVLSQILFHGNGCQSEKCSLQHSMAHPRNSPPYRRKNLTDIFYTSRVIANFVPNFVAMETGGGSVGENAISSIQWPIPENPLIDAKISQISHTQTEFCLKFCSMATGVYRKNAVCSIRWPIPETPPYRRKNIAKNLLRKPSYSPFCPKFRCHGNQGGSGVKLNDTVRFAIPENHT